MYEYLLRYTSDVTTSPARLDYFVDGMGCAICVRKVVRRLEALPGTAEVRTSFNERTQILYLDQQQTPREQLEKNLRLLGHAPSMLSAPTMVSPAADAHAGHDHAAQGVQHPEARALAVRVVAAHIR